MENAKSDKLFLKFNNFENGMRDAFKGFKNKSDFCDVTLACEDGQIEAHKLILSSCSPVFHSILVKNPHQHPLLYLKGVKFNEIVSVLDFMYSGEVNIDQSELSSFLLVAEDLKITGLTQKNVKQESINQMEENINSDQAKDTNNPTYKQTDDKVFTFERANMEYIDEDPKQEKELQSDQIKTELNVFDPLAEEKTEIGTGSGDDFEDDFNSGMYLRT